MTLKSEGRTKLNIKVFTEQIHKTENIYFLWKHRWSWLVPEYKKLQEELERTNPPELVPKVKDTRSLLPYPNSVNHEYGWVASKEHFRLDKWGPDLFSFPINPPKEDGDDDT